MNYKNIYDKIIQRRKSYKYDGLTENHHILPKSIYPECKNSADNIVALSLREHFICHKLLVKIFEKNFGKASVQYKKMLIAFASMTNYKRYSKYVTARDYEKARTEFHRAQSDILKRAWKNYPKEKMDALRKKRSVNSSGENNPMYRKDWRDGKTPDEIKLHKEKTKLGLASRTESEKAESIRKSLETKSKYTPERRMQMLAKRADSIKKFNLAHPGFRRAVAEKSAAKTAGNKLMVNLNNPTEEKRVLAPDIENYVKAGWKIKSEIKDTTNAAYGRKWMYNPLTLEQAYPKREDIQAYLNIGYKFGNIKNYKRNKNRNTETETPEIQSVQAKSGD